MYWESVFTKQKIWMVFIRNMISGTCAGSSLLPLPGSSQDTSCVCGRERVSLRWSGWERRAAAPPLSCLWPPLPPPLRAAPPLCSRLRSWDGRRWPCLLWRSRRRTPRSCCRLPLLPPAPEQETIRHKLTNSLLFRQMNNYSAKYYSTIKPGYCVSHQW